MQIEKTKSQNLKKKGGTKKPPQEQVIKKVKNFIINNANIDPLYKDCTLRNFKSSILSQKNKNKYRRVSNYINGIDTAIDLPQSIYLFSEYPGIGKTHLAVAALHKAAEKIAEEVYRNKEVIQYGNIPFSQNWAPVYFINVSEGLMDMKNDMEGSDQDFTRSKIYQNVKHSRLVVLDDIFNEIRYSPFVLETLLYWIDFRLKNNRATIFTSNHDFQIFLNNETNPINNERLRIISRNIASRVNKMVMNYKIAFYSSPDTDYRAIRNR
ncbi:MAG: hypothetical protein ACOC4L_02120 [Halanaerobium sp.]